MCEQQLIFASKFEIQCTVRAIDEINSKNNLTPDEISRELHNHIQIRHFFQSDIGKFVQVAMLVGHGINPLKFFEGSEASWDWETPVKVLKVVFNGEKDFQDHNLVEVQVLYGKMALTIVKNATEVLRLFY